MISDITGGLSFFVCGFEFNQLHKIKKSLDLKFALSCIINMKLRNKNLLFKKFEAESRWKQIGKAGMDKRYMICRMTQSADGLAVR